MCWTFEVGGSNCRSQWPNYSDNFFSTVTGINVCMHFSLRVKMILGVAIGSFFSLNLVCPQMLTGLLNNHLPYHELGDHLSLRHIFPHCWEPLHLGGDWEDRQLLTVTDRQDVSLYQVSCSTCWWYKNVQLMFAFHVVMVTYFWSWCVSRLILWMYPNTMYGVPRSCTI